MVPPPALAGGNESANWGTSLLLTRALVKNPFTSTKPVSSTVRFAAGAGVGADGGWGAGGGGGGFCPASGAARLARAASATRDGIRISAPGDFGTTTVSCNASSATGKRASH